jgi:Ca2+/H+ antiporter
VIEARLLYPGDNLLGSIAFIAIIILGLCVMVGAVKREDVFRYLGAIVGVVILLIVLPAIIATLRNSMTFVQHLGIALFVILICSFFIGIWRTTKSRRR